MRKLVLAERNGTHVFFGIRGLKDFSTPSKTFLTEPISHARLSLSLSLCSFSSPLSRMGSISFPLSSPLSLSLTHGAWFPPLSLSQFFLSKPNKSDTPILREFSKFILFYFHLIWTNPIGLGLSLHLSISLHLSHFSFNLRLMTMFFQIFHGNVSRQKGLV